MNCTFVHSQLAFSFSSPLPPSDSDLCFLGQYYEWQMKRGKFDGNKSGFILIYAAFCPISCPRWTTAIVRRRHVARHHHSPEDKKTRALHFTKLHLVSLRCNALHRFIVTLHRKLQNRHCMKLTSQQQQQQEVEKSIIAPS